MDSKPVHLIMTPSILESFLELTRRELSERAGLGEKTNNSGPRRIREFIVAVYFLPRAAALRPAFLVVNASKRRNRRRESLR